jgi:hypothetical protein
MNEKKGTDMSNNPNMDKLIGMIDDEMLDSRDVAIACIKWMGENDIYEMMDANEWSDRFMEDDGQPDEAQEWADFDPEC